MNILERYRRLTLWNRIAFWGSLASIFALMLTAIPDSGEEKLQLKSKLVGYLRDLDTIERNWESEYHAVEPLANRAISLLREEYPESANAIADSKMSADAAKHLATVMRIEFEKVIDSIDVEPD